MEYSNAQHVLFILLQYLLQDFIIYYRLITVYYILYKCIVIWNIHTLVLGKHVKQNFIFIFHFVML